MPRSMGGSSATASASTRVRAPRLRRSDTGAPGIRRRRRGGSFFYLWPDGERVRDEATLQRIADLKIPPAWRQVWIAPWPDGCSPP